MDGDAVDAVAGAVWDVVRWGVVGAVRWGVGGVGWRVGGVGWCDVDVVDAGVDWLVVAEAIELDAVAWHFCVDASLRCADVLLVPDVVYRHCLIGLVSQLGEVECVWGVFSHVELEVHCCAGVAGVVIVATAVVSAQARNVLYLCPAGRS